MPEEGWDQGAESPEAEAVDGEISAELRSEIGPFGPVVHGDGNAETAIDILTSAQSGEVRAAFNRPELGDVDFIWGRADDAEGKGGYGLAHIPADSPIPLADVPRILREGEVYDDPKGLPRAYVAADADPARFVVIRLEWRGQPQDLTDDGRGRQLGEV